MSKVVYKYGTGQEIPNNAKYLCTKVETLTEKVPHGEIKKNLLVWHYYEYELHVPAAQAEEKASGSEHG